MLIYKAFVRNILIDEYEYISNFRKAKVKSSRPM